MFIVTEYAALRISPEFLIDHNRALPFLSKTVPQCFIIWVLIALRQDVKIIDNSVVVHELQLAIKRDLKNLL